MKSKRHEPRTSIDAKLSKKTTIKSADNEIKSISKWTAEICKHLHLYHPMNHIMTNYHYYSIQFLEVSDIDVLLGKRKQYLQISCIIFNNHSQTFIGSTYSSEMFDIEPKNQEKPASSCQKSVYFYTELDDIVVKVGVWRLQSDKNGKGIENMSKRVYIGGFDVTLGQSMQTGIVQRTLDSNQIHRFTPTSQEETIQTEQSEEGLKKKQSKIIFRIINTHSLAHLHHFIPPNHIFDCHDYILGLKDNKIGRNGEIQMGDRNRLHFEMKSLSVPLATMKYLAQVSEQKISSSFPMSGRSNITIKEVRLNLQFHNGWKSICQQSFVLKEMNSQSGIIETNRSVVPSKMASKNSKFKQPVQKNRIYYFQKPKQLKAVFPGEGGILIMWLEAKIQCKFDIVDENNKKSNKTQYFYLPIAFALKSIPQQQQSTINIELKMGNVYNLPNLITYITQLKANKFKDDKHVDQTEKIICNVSFLLKRTGGTIENIETVEKEMNQIESLKIEKQRLTQLKRKIKQEKRKKLIQLNQQIPLLDTIQLKQQLYEQKITKIKNQKLQQEQILLFLKSKLNQLQRQTFKNQLNYEEADENEDQIDTKAIKIKKLPNNFIDYRPEPQVANINESININLFKTAYHQMAMAPFKIASPNLISQCINTETFIQFKITQLQVYHEQIQSLSLLFPNFEGGLERLPLTTTQYHYKTVQAKITFSKQKTQLILNQLLNGFFTICMECDDNKKLQISALVTVGQLIEKCQSGDLLQSIQKYILFWQEGTLISQICLAVAFTSTSNTVKAQPSPSKVRPLQNQSGMFSILNRINRFKQQRGGQDNKKQEMIQKIVSNLNVTKKDVPCRQLKNEKIILNIKNSSSNAQAYHIHIFDEDSTLLAKQQLTILQINNSLTNEVIPLNPKTKAFEVPSTASCQIILTYISSRMNINLTQVENIEDYDMSPYLFKIYNHPHKITINITQSQTNIIISRYQINIIPEYQFNTCTIERFLFKPETISFPIITNNLKLITAKNDIVQNPMRLDLNVPQLSNSQIYLSQFSLIKQSPQGSTTFQNFNFYGWGCQRLDIDGRLWQKKDVLIKIPLEVVLEREINLPYQIQAITVISRHVSLKIRQSGEFKYSSTLNINRKNTQILLRAQLMLDMIGKCTYGVQIADKNMKIFHRIGIYVNVDYPTLAPHQIFPIKLPNDRLDEPEPFQYKNQQQVGLDYELKCFKPHLLRFVQKKCFLKVGQEWKIEMLFNWNRIVSELLEQEKDQLSILIGIKSRLTIQYLLFKIKNN